ncbi:hypothetical protein NKG94_16530 [Micromonospora sp. M12]
MEQRILRTDGSLAPPTVPSTVATRSHPPSHRPDEPSARPPSDGLAAVARWSVPNQLPPDIPDFTGRDAEADLLRTLLVPTTLPAGAMRVVAISGMGGVGKTALAVHAAHDSRSSYPDGLLYVNLRGTDASALDPSDVLGRFLRATGLDSQAVPDDTLERSELLRSRLDGRRCCSSSTTPRPRSRSDSCCPAHPAAQSSSRAGPASPESRAPAGSAWTSSPRTGGRPPRQDRREWPGHDPGR